MAKLRLDKILTDSGLCSRREAAERIRRGSVTVNGMPVWDRAEKFDPSVDVITLAGRPLVYSPAHYVMLNKPAGVVSATEDGRDATALDLLDEEHRRMGLFPAGRLDKDAEGLLLLTDDGNYAHRVISPKNHVDKLYYVRVDGTVTEADQDAVVRGLVLADGFVCQPGEFYPLRPGEALVRIHEGKFHQVKRMLASLGKPVAYLRRMSIGALALDESLEPGAWRELTHEEAQRVFEDPGPVVAAILARFGR